MVIKLNDWQRRLYESFYIICCSNYIFVSKHVFIIIIIISPLSRDKQNSRDFFSKAFSNAIINYFTTGRTYLLKCYISPDQTMVFSDYFAQNHFHIHFSAQLAIGEN